MKNKPLLVLAVLTLLVLGRMVACVLSVRPRPNEPQRQALQHVGDGIVNQVEVWKLSHGAYPESLETARIETQSTSNGDWEYFVSAERDSFELRMGDYDRDGFALFWNSTKRAWHMDT